MIIMLNQSFDVGSMALQVNIDPGQQVGQSGGDAFDFVECTSPFDQGGSDLDIASTPSNSGGTVDIAVTVDGGGTFTVPSGEFLDCVYFVNGPPDDYPVSLSGTISDPFGGVTAIVAQGTYVIRCSVDEECGPGEVCDETTGLCATPSPSPTASETPTRTPTPESACADVIDIPSAGGTFAGTTAGGSTLTGSGNCAGGAGPEQVFRWVPDDSGPWVIETCGENTFFDTVVYVRAGDCASGPEVGCNDDGCPIAASQQQGSSVLFSAQPSQTYFVVVDGFASDSAGDFALSVRSVTCGGFVGIPCENAGDFCEPDFCGADASGVCRTRPVQCPPKLNAPVCGCNGTTYTNDCVREIAGTGLSSLGPCGF